MTSPRPARPTIGARPSPRPSAGNVFTRPRRRRLAAITLAGASVSAFLTVAEHRLDAAESLRSAWGETTTVAVASRPLRSGDIIDESAAITVRWPAGAAFDGTLDRVPYGQRLNRALGTGEPITASAVGGDADSVPADVVLAVQPVGPVPPVRIGESVVLIGSDGRVEARVTDAPTDPTKSESGRWTISVAIDDGDVEQVAGWGDAVRVGVAGG